MKRPTAIATIDPVRYLAEASSVACSRVQPNSSMTEGNRKGMANAGALNATSRQTKASSRIRQFCLNSCTNSWLVIRTGFPDSYQEIA